MIIFILVLLILDKGDSADRRYVDRSRDTHHYGRESKSLIESYFRPQTPPQFLNRGNLLTVPKGSSVTLPCRVENLGENTVIWKKGSRQIFVGNIKVRKDLRSSIIDGTSLKIEAVDTMYAGNYTCEIEWSENEAPMEITHLLEVLVPPSVRAADRDKHDDDFPDIRLAREGGNITLTCIASGIPKPTITWMTKQENWVNVKANRLTIASVRRSDAGKYSCIASNGVGYPKSYNFTLSVQHSPIVTPGENPVISGPGAVKAELNCLVESEPSSTVNWYFNGSRISSPKDPRYRMEQNKHNFSLIIFNVKETDLGIYTCSADNRIGQGETDIVLSEDEQRCLEERWIKAIISNKKDFYCAAKELGCPRSELVQFYYSLPKESYRRIKNGLTRLRRRRTKEGEVTKRNEGIDSQDAEEQDVVFLYENNGVKCIKDFCSLGCICSSLHRGPVTPRHCGNLSCMFECSCGYSPKPSKRDNRPISAEDIPSSNSFFIMFDENLSHKRVPLGISRVLLRYIPKEGKLSLTRHVHLPPVNSSQFWIFISLDQDETYTSLHWKSIHIKTKSVIALVNECLKHNSGKRMFYPVPGFTKNFSIIAVPGLNNFVFAGPIKSSSPTITEPTKDIMVID